MRIKLFILDCMEKELTVVLQAAKASGFGKAGQISSRNEAFFYSKGDFNGLLKILDGYVI